MLLSEIDADTVAAEVVLLRAAADRTVLILEGSSDYKLFMSFIDERQCDIVMAGGKENAVAAIYTLERRRIRGIIAIVDQDYDSFLKIQVSSENVIVTEFHDVELMLARSPAFEKVLVECGSFNKIKVLNKQGIELRKMILDAVHPLGILRLYSLSIGASLKFEGIRYQFISRDMRCDIPMMISEVFNHSRKQERDYADVRDFVLQRLDGDHDQWQVCCGHDFMVGFGRALQKVFGSMNAGEATGAAMESRLRLAFGAEEFRKTDLYRKVKEWEQRNLPYICLRF